MQPHLMLETDHLKAVGLAEVTVLVGQVFGHQKERDALCAGHPIRQPRQHKVTDVFGKIIITPGNIDLLAGDRIGAIAVVFCLCGQRPHVRPRLRLGEVHGARPFAGDQLGQIQRLQRIRGVMLQRLNLALAHERGQLQAETRARHHLIDRGGQRHRQPHAAIFGVCAHPDPAALSDGLVAVTKPRRGAQDAIFQPRRFQIAAALQRGHYLVTHLARLREDRGHQIIVRFGETLRCGDLLIAKDLLQQELILGNGGAVAHRGTSSHPGGRHGAAFSPKTGAAWLPGCEPLFTVPWSIS